MALLRQHRTTTGSDLCAVLPYRYSEPKAEKIHKYERTLVSTIPQTESIKMVISEAAKALNSALEALGKLHSEMDALSAQLPEYETVMDMYGVGKILGSQLIAEIGDIRKLHSGKALVAMAGIDPPHHQSGTVDTRGQEAYLNEALRL